MRWMLMLTLLVLPLQAQDGENENEPAEEPRATSTVEVLKWAADLHDPDPEKRAAAEKKLMELAAAARPLSVRGPGIFGSGVIIKIDGKIGGESMSGRWQENGAEGTWKMKKLPTGMYRLEAEFKTVDGEVDKIVEEATYGDLLKKYPSLKGRAAFFSPGGLMAFGTPKPAEKTWRTALGATLRRPSEDLRYHLTLHEKVGFVVTEVDEGSRAAHAGLEKFDVVVAVDGSPVTKPAQLERLKTATLDVVRYAKKTKIHLVE